MTSDIPIQIANMTSPVIVRAEDPWSPLTILTLILAGATVFLAIVAIRQAGDAKNLAESTKTQADAIKTQTDLMKQEFESSHRAWIGLSNQGISGTAQNNFTFIYKNYGKTAASNVQERWATTNIKPTRDSIKNNNANLSESSVTLPTQERPFTIQVNPETYGLVLGGHYDYYVWVIIDYSYLDKNKGQYGVIGKFNQDRTITVIDEWVF